ncbi:hypothetical protein [Salinimonas chungwhensis]|uniref:hypothetical protein n=1 Tax=Salinimonas chungwhensis TaxID=265425 RepID=UPI00036795EC|nr:hypothetical protein [Salinimonas chungwhensis]
MPASRHSLLSIPSDALDALSSFCTLRHLSVHSLEMAAHNIVARLNDSVSLEVILLGKNKVQMILQYPHQTENVYMSRTNGRWEHRTG